MRKIKFFAIISGFAILFSCHTQSDLGYDLLPDGDKINPKITDTFSIEVYTYPEDTISANSVSALLLGEYIDPIFGYSKASFVCQFGLAEYPTFNATDIGDSVILNLFLDTLDVNFYGNTLTPQLFKIYRLPDGFISDTTYFSNQDPSEFMSGELIGEYEYIYDINNDTLKIPLNPSLAQLFIDADADVYSSTANLIDFFKGIYITSECAGGDGAIYKFKVSTESVINIYYHSDGSTSIKEPFKITSNLSSVKKFNLFEHDYSGTPFFSQLGNETPPQDSVAYIQSMGGVRVKIKIPYLENLNQAGEIAIYRAELIIKTAPSTLTNESQYAPIKNMLLAGYDEENEFYLLSEYFAGNTYLAEQLEDNEYRFQIAGYIRDILDGNTENMGLWLFAYSGSDYFNRSVITTGDHTDKMKLIITYVKL